MDVDFTNVDQMREYRDLIPETPEQPEPEALN